MVVGAVRLELLVVGSRSLKQKRGVVRSIVRRLSSRFAASVGEVGAQDSREHAVIGVAIVGMARPIVEYKLERLVLFFESLHLADLLDYQLDVVAFPPVDVGDVDSTDVREFDEAFALAFGGSPVTIGKNE